jgi:hypothetical protein
LVEPAIVEKVEVVLAELVVVANEVTKVEDVTVTNTSVTLTETVQELPKCEPSPAQLAVT